MVCDATLASSPCSQTQEKISGSVRTIHPRMVSVLGFPRETEPRRYNIYTFTPSPEEYINPLSFLLFLISYNYNFYSS